MGRRSIAVSTGSGRPLHVYAAVALVSVVIALALAPRPAAAETRLNFVSCPIVRDTPTVPCWLAEHDGELYYMGIQTDVSAEFHPPLLGHRVLVEGVVAEDRPRICGGIVLEPVTISPLPELDGSCNRILPIDPRYTIDFNPRPPGPSGGRLAFESAPGEPAPAPVPSGAKTFSLYFEIDKGVSFGHPRALLEIRNWARAIDASRVTVSGLRGTTLLSDGALLEESAGTAERRSRQVAELLTGLGLDARIRVEFTDEPAPADGVDDWMSRRVDVRVEP